MRIRDHDNVSKSDEPDYWLAAAVGNTQQQSRAGPTQVARLGALAFLFPA